MEGSAADGKVILVNFIRETPDRYRLFMQLDREFEERNPDITIDNINIPNADYFIKLLSMTAAGKPPDMVLFDSTNLPLYVKRGLVLDLRPYIERDPDVSLNDYFPEAIARCSYQGGVYGLPTDTAVALPFYNLDLFDQAGIPYPSDDWTWEDYLRIAKTLTRDLDGDGKIDIWGSGGIFWIQYIYCAGGTLVDDPLDPQRCTVDSPETMEAIQWLADLSLVHRVAPTTAQLASEDYDDLFMSGKVAMNVTGHWLVPRYREIKSFRWDVAAVPTGKGGKAVLNFGSCYSIPAGTKYPEEAWRLLKYYSSEEVGRRLAEFGYFTPANKKVALSAEFLDNPLPPKSEQKFLDAMDYAHPFPFSSKTAQIIDRIGSDLDVVFNGEKKAVEVCPQIARKITRILQEED